MYLSPHKTTLRSGTAGTQSILVKVPERMDRAGEENTHPQEQGWLDPGP